MSREVSGDTLVVDIVPTPAATLVTVSGEVDLTTVAQFRERLDTAPDCDAVMEMSDVALLSAVGLRVLLDLQDRLAAVGAWLVLAAPAHPVRRVLDVTGLDVRLPIGINRRGRPRSVEDRREGATDDRGRRAVAGR